MKDEAMQVHPPRASGLKLLEVAVELAATAAEWNRHSTWTQRRDQPNAPFAPSRKPQFAPSLFAPGTENLKDTEPYILRATREKEGVAQLQITQRRGRR